MSASDTRKPNHPAQLEKDAERVFGASHGGLVWLANGQRGTVNDFSANIWPFPFSGQVMPDQQFSNVDVYPDPDYRELTSAAAHYYEVAENQIFPANGSTEALYLSMLLLKPKKVAIFEPTFTEYSRAARWATSSHLEVIQILANVRDGFRHALCVPEVDVAIICNPNNPTGAYIPSRDLLSWINACERKGVFVIVDEAFVEFVQEHQASVACEAASRANVLVLRSMTKCFGIPGLRLGFAIAPEALVQRLRTNRIPWSVNAIAQEFGICLARGSSAARVKTAEIVAQERTFLSHHLRELGWTVLPSAANFVLCRLPGGASNRGTLTKLLHEGFLLRNAGNFYGLDDSYVRCAVKGRADNELLLKAIAKCT